MTLRNGWLLFLVLCLVMTVPSPVLAGWDLGGNVVCSAAHERYNLRLIPDGGDGVFCSWTDRRDLVSQVYLQHMDAQGNPLWQTDGQPVSETADNAGAVIVADGTGGVFVAWRASGLLVALHWNAAGQESWSDPVRFKLDAYSQGNCELILDGAAGFIAVWYEMGLTEDRGVFVQRVDADGIRLWGDNGRRICDYDGSAPRLCTDDDGGAYVAWSDRRIMPHLDIYAQHVDHTGTPLWEENGRPVCQVAFTQLSANVVPDDTGGVYVVWRDFEQEPHGIYAQHYDDLGAALWQENGVPVLGNGLGSEDFAVASDSFGGLITVWAVGGYEDRDLRGQRLDSQGQPLWDSDGVPITEVDRDQYQPALVVGTTGDCYVIWQDARRGACLDIFGQKIDTAGNVQWQMNGVWVAVFDNQQLEPVIALGGPEEFYASWIDHRTDDEVVYLLPIGSAGSGVSEECSYLSGVPEAMGPALLRQNHPNPFNPQTNISFVLPQAMMVRLSVCDARGRIVDILIDDQLPAGPHQVVWNGRDTAGRNAPSGTYLYRLLVQGKALTRKMTLLR
jgi:hypothetical protein